jgi:2-desacetyl-2-hydroxyethyl bacteriochlorophyllide A dehydrogenase
MKEMDANKPQEARRMRQVWLEEPEHISVRQAPCPDPRAGQVLVRTEQVGICGSDLHAYHGRHPFITLPVVPGHEAVGTVELAGEGVSNIKPGDRVILEPNIICGECEYCRSGRYNLCDHLTVVGCVGPLHGAMADFFIAPATRFVVADPRLNLAEATMVEPLATGTHAVRVSGGVTGKRVAVLGAGAIGLLTLQAAKAAGASTIVATDLNLTKRDLARSLGATAAFDPTQPDVVDQMRRQLGGHADVVFDCVSIQQTMDQAIALALKGGTVVVVGVPEDDVRVPLALIQDREVRIQGSAMYTREDVLEAMRLIAEGEVDVRTLVTQTFSLDQAAAGFAAANAGGEVKVQLIV